MLIRSVLIVFAVVTAAFAADPDKAASTPAVSVPSPVVGAEKAPQEKVVTFNDPETQRKLKADFMAVVKEHPDPEISRQLHGSLERGDITLVLVPPMGKPMEMDFKDKQLRVDPIGLVLKNRDEIRTQYHLALTHSWRHYMDCVQTHDAGMQRMCWGRPFTEQECEGVWNYEYSAHVAECEKAVAWKKADGAYLFCNRLGSDPQAFKTEFRKRLGDKPECKSTWDRIAPGTGPVHSTLGMR